LFHVDFISSYVAFCHVMQAASTASAA
jgi:hypothetical protein